MRGRHRADRPRQHLSRSLGPRRAADRRAAELTVRDSLESYQNHLAELTVGRLRLLT